MRLTGNAVDLEVGHTASDNWWIRTTHSDGTKTQLLVSKTAISRVETATDGTATTIKTWS